YFKMATNSVVLCNRMSSKTSRLRLEGVDFSGNVSIFRKNISQRLDINAEEIELVYCGRCLKDEDTVTSYGVRPGATVHVLKSNKTELPSAVQALDNTAVQQCVTALQNTLENPAYRHIVERMLSDPKTLENIVAATPGVDKDPVALAMLQDPDTLSILADKDVMLKAIESHPCMGHAAQMVAAAVKKEVAKGTTSSSRGTYSMDQMDEEDFMGSSRSRGPQQAITTNQLAAALAMANSSSSSRPTESMDQSSSSNSTSRPDNSSASANQITNDFIRYALQAASGAPPGGSTEASAMTRENLQSQLQQLHDMGISDEATALRALQATGGNVQAALELIFGDGTF
ncbi:unnamed protein product, partial [Owenia fusiformis]